jgi:uncharacterized protein
MAPGVTIGASPSFDCDKAGSWSEKYLCGDDELAALNRQMAALYSEARANATEGEKKGMTGDQRAWLRQREGCKGTAKERTCLHQLYGSRIAQLTAAGPTLATEASADFAAVASGASAALPEFVLAEDPSSSTEPVATDGGDAGAPEGALPIETAVLVQWRVQRNATGHRGALHTAPRTGQTPASRAFMRCRSADRPAESS